MSVDLSGQLFKAYETSLAKAKLAYQNERYGDAAAAYRQAATFLDRYAQYSRSADARARWLRQAGEYRELADRLESGAFVVPPARATETPGGKDVYDDVITGLIQRSAVTWDDIADLEETKREIKAAYGMALARKPSGVKLEAWRNILFYGPPGTGKTLLAAATSHGLEATFFNVKVSDLLSKYFGESSRLISALYETARRLNPAVVFLDEFESLSPPRDGGQSGPEARIVSTFLAELDGLAQKGDDRLILTIAATNVPWVIDRAMLSRFEKKIYVPLPEETARRRLFELELDRKGHSSEVGRDQLVARTKGYSGREVSQLCRDAVKEMVNRLNAELTARVDEGREAVAEYQIKVGPIRGEEWDLAFSRIRPVTKAADLLRYETWAGSAG